MIYHSSLRCNSCHIYTTSTLETPNKNQENLYSVAISDIVAIEAIAGIAAIVTSDATVSIVKPL